MRSKKYLYSRVLIIIFILSVILLFQVFDKPILGAIGGGVCWNECVAGPGWGFVICQMGYSGYYSCSTPNPDLCLLSGPGCSVNIQN